LILEEQERRRLARELHDTTAQSLAALSMNLSVVGESADVLSPRAQAAMAEAVALADQCLRELRTVSYLLHPSELEELGLESALSRYIDGFIQRSGIPVEAEVSPGLGRLPPDVEMTVFRVVQECLTNIHRHSGASCKRKRSC
jgi:signal transduction histidine kinase